MKREQVRLKFNPMRHKKKIRFLEFLLIGVIMGLVEDLLAISLATDAQINFKVIWIVLLVAIPFAYISEIIVDKPTFWEKTRKKLHLG